LLLVPQWEVGRGNGSDGAWPVEAAALGRVLMHEHVFMLGTEIRQNYPDAWGDEESQVSGAVARLRALKERGIDTIVDPAVIGLGRYLPRIQQINEQADINIRPATDDVLPALRERGVTEEQINTMVVGNPRHYLGG
jgi:predicted metal-dependent phosphotriesterase family hydrolase